ncbi:MAG TPA: porin family protein [Flavisolibacter sp.]|nr:porin family protein [Flavisolibacter sp.]
MKKISLFVLALCTSAAVFAQDTQPQLRTPMERKVRFGIRAGANFASVNMSDVPNGPEINTKTSLHGGVFVNAPLGGMFAIQPGVEYGGQGAKVKQGTANAEWDLHYVNVPIMFQWKSAGGFLLETGPQAGFLVGAKADDVDVKDQFDTFDFTWGAGLGYLSRIGLGVNARYNLGINNIVNDEAGLDGKIKNNVIQVGLVYHFGAHR